MRIQSLALALWLLGAGVEALPLGDPGSASRVVIEALRAARDPKAPLEECTARIAEQREDALPRLLGILGDQRVPAPPDEPGAREQQLSVVQREMIDSALRRQGRRAVLAPALALLAGEARQRADFIAIQLLGAVGAADDLPDLLARTLPEHERTLHERERTAFERSLTQMLKRDAGTYEVLERVGRRIRPELTEPILLALGAAGNPRGLDFVQRVLESEPGAVRIALAQLCRIGPSLSAHRNKALLELVRPLARAPEREVSQAGVLVLAKFGDLTSVHDWIGLLGHESSGVRENAYWALKQVTGLRLPPNRELWTEWYQAEAQWLDHEAPALLQQLTTSSPDRVAQAARELARHPLHRDVLAHLVGSELPSQPHALRAFLCKSLGALGSYESVPVLLEAADGQGTVVGDAAWEGLLLVTGRTLPRDVEVWRAALSAEE